MSEVGNREVAIVNRGEYVAAIVARVKIVAAETRIVPAQTIMFDLGVFDDRTALLGRKAAIKDASQRGSSRLRVVKKENLIAHLSGIADLRINSYYVEATLS